MTTSNSMNANEEATFRIGTASRMTGIAVDTLRVWERRYGVVKPLRSQGADRLYRQQDIKRLTLLKKLVDRGHAIGTIARLSDDKLAEQLRAYEEQVLANNITIGSQRALRVAVLGDLLVHRIKNEVQPDDLQFIGLHKSQLQFETTIVEQNVDAIVLEYSAIHNDTVRDVRRMARQSGAHHVFIVYGFTSSKVLETFNSSDYTLLQAPVSLTRLYSELRGVFTQTRQQPAVSYLDESVPPAPPRIFSNNGLVDAYNASSTVKCECPQHLSTIIQKLIQFEIYSADCENRNEQDAALHAYLKAATGNARAIIENALKHVLEAEGLDIDFCKQS